MRRRFKKKFIIEQISKTSSPAKKGENGLVFYENIEMIQINRTLRVIKGVPVKNEMIGDRMVTKSRNAPGKNYS